MQFQFKAIFTFQVSLFPDGFLLSRHLGKFVLASDECRFLKFWKKFEDCTDYLLVLRIARHTRKKTSWAIPIVSLASKTLNGLLQKCGCLRFYREF